MTMKQEIADINAQAVEIGRIAKDIRDGTYVDDDEEEAGGSCSIRLRDLVRLNSGSYGGMPPDEDGKYFRVADVVELLTEISRADDPAAELLAQLSEFSR